MVPIPDSQVYSFFTFPRSALDVSLERTAGSRPELRLFGTLEAVASLANIFLWVHANAVRREYLSLGELPFVRLGGSLSVGLNVLMADDTHNCGTIVRLDKDMALEWQIPEDALPRVGLILHHLASVPEHEYERLLMDSASYADVQVRITNLDQWL